MTRKISKSERLELNRKEWHNTARQAIIVGIMLYFATSLEKGRNNEIDYIDVIFTILLIWSCLSTIWLAIQNYLEREKIKKDKY